MRRHAAGPVEAGEIAQGDENQPDAGATGGSARQGQGEARQTGAPKRRARLADDVEDLPDQPDRGREDEHRDGQQDVGQDRPLPLRGPGAASGKGQEGGEHDAEPGQARHAVPVGRDEGDDGDPHEDAADPRQCGSGVQPAGVGDRRQDGGAAVRGDESGGDPAIQVLLDSRLVGHVPA